MGQDLTYNKSVSMVVNLAEDFLDVAVIYNQQIIKGYTIDFGAKVLKEEIEAIKLEQQYYEKFNHQSLIDVDKYKFKNSQSLINYVTKYQEDTKDRKFTFFLWLKLILKYGFSPDASVVFLKSR